MTVNVRFAQNGMGIASPQCNIPYISASILYMSVFN